jgi:hypothetical protein
VVTQPLVYQYSLLANQFNSFRYEYFRARKLNCYELLSTQFRLIYNHITEFNPAVFVFFIIDVLSDYKYRL